MTEQQWTQLSAELKAAETSKKLFNQLLTRIRQLEAAVEASEVPEKPEAAPPTDYTAGHLTPLMGQTHHLRMNTNHGIQSLSARVQRSRPI